MCSSCEPAAPISFFCIMQMSWNCWIHQEHSWILAGYSDERSSDLYEEMIIHCKMCHVATFKKMQCCDYESSLFTRGICGCKDTWLHNKGWNQLLDYWTLLQVNVKGIKKPMKGSEKGETLPLFWCPSSTAPPWSWIWKDKKVWTMMHLSPNNLLTLAHTGSALSALLL